MKDEIWKDIPNYEGLYQASPSGNIKSLYRNKILKYEISKNGYCQVMLCKNKKQKLLYVHRLVAMTYLNNFNEKLQVNHKDGNKQNNNINNLEMVTCKENIQHSFKNKLQVIKSGEENHLYNRYGQYANKSKPIYQYDLEGNFIKQWNCQKDVERELGFKVQNISACALGNKKTAYGFIWRNELEV